MRVHPVRYRHHALTHLGVIAAILASGCGRLAYDSHTSGDAALDGGAVDAPASADTGTGSADGAPDGAAEADASTDGATDGAAPACTPTVRPLGPVTACEFQCHDPLIVWDGAGYALCWSRNTTVDPEAASPMACALLDATLTMTGTPFDIPPSTKARAASLTTLGPGRFATAFVDNRLGDHEVYLTRFGAAGPDDPWLRVTTATGEAWGTSIAVGASDIGIAFWDHRDGDTTPDIYFATVDPTDMIRETRVTDLTERAFGPSVAWTGTDYAIAWRDIRDNGSWDLYYAHVDAAGLVQGEAPFPNPTPQPSDGTLAWNGSELTFAYPVVSGTEEVMLTTLEPTPIPPIVVSAPEAAGAARPARHIALSGGAGYVVSWLDSRSGSPEAYVRFVAPDRTLPGPAHILSTAPYSLMGAADAPALAWNGQTLIVAWSEEVTGPGDAEIHLAEVCPD